MKDYTKASWATELGWNRFFQDSYDSMAVDMPPGRISAQHRGLYTVVSETGVVHASSSGRLEYSIDDPADLPVTGDWVLLMLDDSGVHGQVYDVIPRHSFLCRKAAGAAIKAQPLVANVDKLFIISALDGEVNEPRIERFMVLAAEGNIEPILIFNKTDLCEDLDAVSKRLEERFPQYEHIFISALNSKGLDNVISLFSEGITGALVGVSGVGKSTLLNALSEREVQETGEVRDQDHKGRHITTSRELFLLQGGGVLIDTPGLRECGIWATEESIDAVFDDIAALGEKCRYKDCTHVEEAGCEVLAALEAGGLKQEKYDNYLKLRKEIAYYAQKSGNAFNPKARWKDISKEIKRYYKNRQ